MSSKRNWHNKGRMSSCSA